MSPETGMTWGIIKIKKRGSHYEKTNDFPGPFVRRIPLLCPGQTV
jgi:hypothetical protein